MGTYTRLEMNTSLKESTPVEVVNILKHLIDGKGSQEPPHPQHKFFSCNRYKLIALGDSEYVMQDGKLHFRIHSNFKAYDNEITQFIDFITEYVDAEKGEIIGQYSSEDDIEETLIFKHMRPGDDQYKLNIVSVKLKSLRDEIDSVLLEIQGG